LLPTPFSLLFLFFCPFSVKARYRSSRCLSRFGGCLSITEANWLTGLHGWRVRIHLDAELGIPLPPVFQVAYLSVNLLYLPAPFILRSRHELQALALCLAAVTTVAGVCFVVFPAEIG
jgi:hypothetical protein